MEIILLANKAKQTRVKIFLDKYIYLDNE